MDFSTLLDSTYIALVAIDSEGKITAFNRAAERIFGISRKKALGALLSRILPTTKLLTVAKTGEPQLGQRMLIQGQAALYFGTPIKEGDTLVGAVGVFQELGELERISAELTSFRDLTTEYQGLFESSYDGLMMVDGEGRVLRVNQAYCRLVGHEAPELLGQKVQDLHRQGHLEHKSTVEILKSEGTGERPPSSQVHTEVGGKVLLSTSTPIYGKSGKLSRVVVNLRDVTEMNRLRDQLEEIKREREGIRSQLEELKVKEEFSGIIYQSEEMAKTLELAKRVAAYESTVLILGESGVGKELIAKLIHQRSPRAAKPFVDVNCGAIPENLLESELFGYERGAFTGARKEGKAGLFETAQGGTIFLDEVGSLPLASQVKLLKVLQEKVVTKIGSLRPVKVDVRVMAATNQDLSALTREGKLREDLYYRLKVVPIEIKPLRQRREDIPPLIFHFLHRFNKAYGQNKYLSAELIDALCRYSWPGNVRQLENLMERFLVTAEGQEIGLPAMPEDMAIISASSQPPLEDIAEPSLPSAREDLEKRLLREALQEGGSTYKAAKILKVDQSTVYRKAKRYGLI